MSVVTSSYNPDNSQKDILGKNFDDMLANTNFSYLTIKDNNGNIRYTTGTHIATNDNISINQYPFQTRLSESHGDIVLQIEQPLISNGNEVGSLMTEWHFSAFNKTFNPETNKSNENYYICSINKLSQIICIPAINATEEILPASSFHALEKMIATNKEGYLTSTSRISGRIL